MRDHGDRESDLIDLGSVSTETKGSGMIDQDAGITPLNLGAGVLVD